MDNTIFDKIALLQTQYGISKKEYTSVMLAIVEMDYLQDITQSKDTLKETNTKKLDLDSFFNTVNNNKAFINLLEPGIINGVTTKSNKILPNVQQFRLVLDTLTYCLARLDIEKIPKGVKFTMPSTARTGVLENIRIVHCDYSDIDECRSFLDLYSTNKENNTDILVEIDKLLFNTLETTPHLNCDMFKKELNNSKYSYYVENGKVLTKKDGVTVDTENMHNLLDSLLNICFDYMILDVINKIKAKDKAGISLLMVLHKLENKDIRSFYSKKSLVEQLYDKDSDILNYYLKRFFAMDEFSSTDYTTFETLCNISKNLCLD